MTRSEARIILDELVPEYTRTVARTALVPSSSGHPQLVGIAFDYAVRMELQYLAAVTPAPRWVAENAVRILKFYGSSEWKKARGVVLRARKAAERWPRSTAKRYLQISSHAAKLSQLDVVHRAGLLPTFGDADGIAETNVADEVAELLGHADALWRIATRPRLLLNPHFEDASLAVGGADADLIVDRSVIEIKTTKAGVIERDQMRQLVGYACLARASGVCNAREVGVYLSRFGVLYNVPLPSPLRSSAYVQAAAHLAALWQRRLAA